MSEINAERKAQEKFKLRLPGGGRILDFGERCGGSGFLDPKYPVTPMCAGDGKMRMERLCVREHYDGVWTGEAVSFLPREELVGVMRLIARSLRQNGVVYLCFQEGDFEGLQDGRYRTEFTVRSFRHLICETCSLKLEEVWFEPQNAGRKMNLLLTRAA